MPGDLTNVVNRANGQMGLCILCKFLEQDTSVG